MLIMLEQHINRAYVERSGIWSSIAVAYWECNLSIPVEYQGQVAYPGQNHSVLGA
jgi:hypothetical protein